MGNPLERLLKVIDFELFRGELEAALLKKNPNEKRGAKPFDFLLLFKIMILQRYYGLSDQQMEYQIVDRLSFRKFLGLETGDKVPDEKTIWYYREKLVKANITTILFKKFTDILTKKGLVLNEGQIVDASFVTAPRQRNSKKENEAIKKGSGGELWKDKPKKKQQKDIDARWTKKNGETIYGYKNHTKVDQKHKIIKSYQITDAATHDSQVLESLLEPSDYQQELYADSAYSGKKQEAIIQSKGMKNKVQEKGCRYKPLEADQKKNNKAKSKIRSRVEHVFGFMEQTMQGLTLKNIGLLRSKAVIGLMNLTYNLFRFEQIERLALVQSS
jgi:IS5 family transposase